MAEKILIITSSGNDYRTIYAGEGERANWKDKLDFFGEGHYIVSEMYRKLIDNREYLIIDTGHYMRNDEFTRSTKTSINLIPLDSQTLPLLEKLLSAPAQQLTNPEQERNK